MPLKQSSFNFDFVPEESVQDVLPVMQEPELDVQEPSRPAVLRLKQLKPQPRIEEPVKSSRGRMKLADMSCLKKVITA